MSAGSKIEWTQATWNPILGCDRVSPGCDRCYAITSATIRAGNPHPDVRAAFAGLTERRDGRLDWTGRINLLPERLTQPLAWRKPKRIFVNSLADLFHADVPDDYISKVFAVMALASQHTFQLLTKRHARMRSLLGSAEFKKAVAVVAVQMAEAEPGPPYLPEHLVIPPTGESWWPLRNVWLGVSVEDQKWADVRIPALRGTPAAVRFLSAEPLLGPLNDIDLAGIGWVICGGESGPKARPMHPQWARGLRDQCIEAGVAYHFKQWGEWGPAPWSVKVCDPAIGWTGTAEELDAAKADSEARGATHAYAVWADQYGWEPFQPSHKPWSVERTSLDETQHAPIRRWGKKAAGRLLDGREWNEYPAEARTGIVLDEATS